MFKQFSFGWVAILAFFVFGFSSCDDDPEVTPVATETVTGVVENNTDRFGTLFAALQRTGLDRALNMPNGSFTVFAPTDMAFEASGIDLNAVSTEQLAQILRYHVVSNTTTFTTDNIPQGVTMLNTITELGPDPDGLAVTVERSGATVTVNNATVVEADITTTNGVIHAINEVLIPPTITSVAAADGRFTTLVAALQRTGLDEVLAGSGDFMVFAPTDDAFAAAGIDLNAVSESDLRALLLYHVSGSSIIASDIPAGDNFVTSLSTTAPNDAPLSILVNNTNGTITINDEATVVVPNVFTSNGLIHAVDQVLMPQSIVDFATKAEGLSSLTASLVQADLVETLSADGPFTVFAPTNEAFAAVADVTADFTVEQLTAVLTYHVVSGANVRSDAIPAEAATANGEMLRFTGAGNTTIQTASGQQVPIAAVDIQATNGVVHLVGTVLLPEEL